MIKKKKKRKFVSKGLETAPCSCQPQFHEWNFTPRYDEKCYKSNPQPWTRAPKPCRFSALGSVCFPPSFLSAIGIDPIRRVHVRHEKWNFPRFVRNFPRLESSARLRTLKTARRRAEKSVVRVNNCNVVSLAWRSIELKRALAARKESFVMVKRCFTKEKKKREKERNSREMTFRNYFERNLHCKRLIECTGGTILMQLLALLNFAKFQISENWIFHRKRREQKSIA